MSIINQVAQSARAAFLNFLSILHLIPHSLSCHSSTLVWLFSCALAVELLDDVRSLGTLLISPSIRCMPTSTVSKYWLFWTMGFVSDLETQYSRRSDIISIFSYQMTNIATSPLLPIWKKPNNLEDLTLHQFFHTKYIATSPLLTFTPLLYKITREVVFWETPWPSHSEFGTTRPSHIGSTSSLCPLNIVANLQLTMKKQCHFNVLYWPEFVSTYQVLKSWCIHSYWNNKYSKMDQFQYCWLLLHILKYDSPQVKVPSIISLTHVKHKQEHFRM